MTILRTITTIALTLLVGYAIATILVTATACASPQMETQHVRSVGYREFSGCDRVGAIRVHGDRMFHRSSRQVEQGDGDLITITTVQRHRRVVRFSIEPDKVAVSNQSSQAVTVEVGCG